MSRLLNIFFLCIMSLSSYAQNTNIDSIISINSAQKLLYFLASDSLKGRLTGMPETKIAADFIASEFKSAALEPLPDYPDYLMPFSFLKQNLQTKIGYNVLAGLSGKSLPNETIIFSAHYDHLGTSSTNPFVPLSKKEIRKLEDTIYNGANDDATGIVALILLARYFSLLKNNQRTLLFVAFSGEELGLFGSSVLADKVAPKQITAVINIEMIGRYSNENNHPFITGDDLSNLKSILNDNLAEKKENPFGNNFFIGDPYVNQKLFLRSDNKSFAVLGIPAHSIMLTSDQDLFYHTVDDEAQTIDIKNMVTIIQAIASGTENLINGTKTPTRIKIYK